MPCFAVARTETRYYDDEKGNGAGLYLPITVTNVAWDSLQQIPSTKEAFYQFVDENSSILELFSYYEEDAVAQFQRVRLTNTVRDIYIGAAAPCTVTFAPGGIPKISRLITAQGEETVHETLLIDSATGSITLEPGTYFFNNYAEGTLEAGGLMYWYSYTLTVQDPATITNADAGVKIIDSATYTGDNFYESCSILTFPHQPPIIREGRTLVPMRAIFEALDATVDWDGEAQTITAAHGDTSVVMQIGSNTMTKNGETVTLDVPPELVNGTTLIPVRAVSEAFGLPVEWDAEYNLVVIRK